MTTDDTKARPSADAVRLTRVLGDLGHEIGTPLGSISMMLEMLADDPSSTLTEGQQAWVRNLGIAASEIRVAVQGLIRLQRIWCGPPRFEAADVAPSTLVGRLAAFEGTISLAGSDFLADSFPSDAAMLRPWRTDAERVVELTTTLAAFAEARGEGLRIGISGDGESLVFEVEVREAIPVENPAVLDPLGSGELKLARRHGGDGLELAIACCLAERLGGGLGASGGGSETLIRVEIPTRLGPGTGSSGPMDGRG